jgi:hypothetical protein
MAVLKMVDQTTAVLNTAVLIGLLAVGSASGMCWAGALAELEPLPADATDREPSGEERPEEPSAEEPQESFDGVFKIPNSKATIGIGGFARLDLIHDFDAIGSEDSFDPSTIPTDGGEGENTRLHAKWTRLNVDFRRPTRRGPARIFVETDFFDSENALRLRHAFATVGPLLVGQTWTTFMDEDAIPATLDLEEPRAFVFVRQALVRWSWNRNDRLLWAVALEDPNAEIEPPVGVAGSSENPLPDLTARVRRNWGASHLQLSAFVGQARFRPESGPDEDATIWGLSLTGKATIVGRDAFRFQLAYGDGLARYHGGLAAAPDENGQLEAIPTLATMVSYRHYWNERLSSHLVASYGKEDNTAGQSSEAIHAAGYAALNLVWEFAEKISFGGEYLYGTREDNDGASGHANRLLLVFKFDFF